MLGLPFSALQSKADALQEALELFPRIYYAIPLLPTVFPVELPNHPKVKLTRPMDAILWLAQLICAKRAQCPRPQLLRLVKWWYPAMTPQKLTRQLQALEQMGCVVVHEDKQVPEPRGDQRVQWIELTPSGLEVLEAIKSHRRRQLEVVFEHVPEASWGTITQLFKLASKLVWTTMEGIKAAETGSD